MATASEVGSDVCSICTEIFTHPKLLPCFHTFCLQCLQQYVSSFSKDDQFPCPLCRYQATVPEKGVTAFQTNFYIEARAERQVHKEGGCCGVCAQQATHSCRECEILLCESCTRCHQTLPSSRSHMLINLDKSDDAKLFLEAQTFCEIHKDEKLRFYCMPCDKAICRDCKLTDHEGHKTKNIFEVAEESRASLKKTKVELEKCKSKFVELFHHIDSTSSETFDKIGNATRDIHQFTDSLVEIINKARCMAIDKLTDVEQIHKKAYSDEHSKIEMRKCFVESLVGRIETTLKEGVDGDVIRTDGEMKRLLADTENDQLNVSKSYSETLDTSSMTPLQPGAGRSSEVERSLMVRWVVGSILHGVDPLSYFSFQPVLHDWCNKGRGMWYPVCGMVHIKEPLLLIDKSSLCGDSGFPFSLSEWSLTICLTPYNRR